MSSRKLGSNLATTQFYWKLGNLKYGSLSLYTPKAD
jgi:hypothetical protein